MEIPPDRPEYPLPISNPQSPILKIERPIGWEKIKNFTNDLNPELVKKISTTELLQLLVENKFKVRCIPVQGQWGEVDIPSDIKLYKKKFKQLS